MLEGTPTPPTNHVDAIIALVDGLGMSPSSYIPFERDDPPPVTNIPYKPEQEQPEEQPSRRSWEDIMAETSPTRRAVIDGLITDALNQVALPGEVFKLAS